MADSSIYDKLAELAVARYNAANPTTPITKDTAYRALVLAIESQIAANVSNASSVTDQI
jgi:hypothetical protein